MRLEFKLFCSVCTECEASDFLKYSFHKIESEVLGSGFKMCLNSMRVCVLKVESGVFAGLYSGCEFSETFENLCSRFKSQEFRVSIYDVNTHNSFSVFVFMFSLCSMAESKRFGVLHSGLKNYDIIEGFSSIV